MKRNIYVQLNHYAVPQKLTQHVNHLQFTEK